jgi:broad specificity phosphatase PhoE
LSYSDVARYVTAYEDAGLAQGASPPRKLQLALAGVVAVCASDARRAAQSVSALGLADGARSDALFREEPLLLPRLIGAWPLFLWLATARALELWRPERHCSPLPMEERADHAAERLIAAAIQGDVALIGHGWFNRAIAQSLSRRGWRSSRRTFCSGPWSFIALHERKT